METDRLIASEPGPELESDTMFINMGPQHPSTHGVLRLGLTLSGEVIKRAAPDVGYLHRGTEKLMETRSWSQCVVLTDRWDYCSAMTSNLAFSLAVEKLLGAEAPPRAQALRVIMCELNRIASHLIFLGTYGIDIGALTPFLYAFREREMILDLYERCCGARLTYNYIRPGGVAADVDEGWIAKCREFLEYLKPRLDEYDALLSFNPIFLARTRDIGLISAETAVHWGLSGPNLRGSGVAYDVRKAEPYCGYENYDFEVPVGRTGSCWDRYFCRVQEMRQSARIVAAALASLPPGELRTKAVPRVVKPAAGEAYAHVEASRGDLGILAVSDGGAAPFRVHVKAPCFINLAILQEILVGKKVADVVAVMGSIDIVLGEVDR
ncbi:MAG: NADH-quinone oxidoreductase subunit D [Elusimicrobia bacterium]|nr:NADH-quinone oxidoreductase subunit D [Elusimicrobiota bacterium]